MSFRIEEGAANFVQATHSSWVAYGYIGKPRSERENLVDRDRCAEMARNEQWGIRDGSEMTISTQLPRSTQDTIGQRG